MRPCCRLESSPLLTRSSGLILQSSGGCVAQGPYAPVPCGSPSRGRTLPSCAMHPDVARPSAMARPQLRCQSPELHRATSAFEVPMAPSQHVRRSCLARVESPQHTTQPNIFPIQHSRKQSFRLALRESGCAPSPSPPTSVYGMVSPRYASLHLAVETTSPRDGSPLDLYRMYSLQFARGPLACPAGPREGCVDRQVHYLYFCTHPKMASGWSLGALNRHSGMSRRTVLRKGEATTGKHNKQGRASFPLRPDGAAALGPGNSAPIAPSSARAVGARARSGNGEES